MTSSKPSRAQSGKAAVSAAPTPVAAKILSMDGGGIYGYTQAIWLRQLCEDDPVFLTDATESEPMYFAGASSGAVNALLLASQDDPRAFVLSGELERFWFQSGLYVNRMNPVDSMLSNVMITAWIGTEDTLAVLHHYFAERKFSDIPKKHRVIISTFNWSGSHKTVFPDEPRCQYATPALPAHASDGCGCPYCALGAMVHGGRYSHHGSPWGRFGSQLAKAFFERFVGPPQGAGFHRPWHPRMFTNFHETHLDDLKQRISDIAYAAMSMPSVRAIRGGVGDGAIFNANPAMDAIVAVLQARRKSLRPVPTIEDQPEVMDAITRLHMLSLGNGAMQPYYTPTNFNFGGIPFSMLPVNASYGPFRPNAYGLNQPIQDASIEAAQLLYGRYFRVNPPVSRFPPGPLVYMIRSHTLRHAILNMIREGTETERSRRMVKRASDFTHRGWKALAADALKLSEPGGYHAMHSEPGA